MLWDELKLIHPPVFTMQHNQQAQSKTQPKLCVKYTWLIQYIREKKSKPPVWFASYAEVTKKRMEAAQEVHFLKENSSPGNHFTKHGFLSQPLAFSSLATQGELNGDAVMEGSPWHCCIPAITLSCLCLRPHGCKQHSPLYKASR